MRRDNSATVIQGLRNIGEVSRAPIKILYINVTLEACISFLKCGILGSPPSYGPTATFSLPALHGFHLQSLILVFVFIHVFHLADGVS